MCTARPRLLVALYAFNPHVGHRGTPAPDFALNRAVSQLGASLVLTGSAWCLPDGCWHGPFVHPEAILPIVVAGLARPRPAPARAEQLGPAHDPSLSESNHASSAWSEAEFDRPGSDQPSPLQARCACAAGVL